MGHLAEVEPERAGSLIQVEDMVQDEFIGRTALDLRG